MSASIALGLLVFLVYLLTLHPSLPGGDAGELITAAHLLGISHPPGYPLHAVLGHAFTWLPVGSVAWRVNLLSAVCGTGAAVVLGRVVAGWTGNSAAGFAAGGLFAFSPLVWSYSVGAEVFALNNLLVALLLAFSWRFSGDPRPVWARGSAFVIGLGVANHHTLFFFALPLVLWAVVRGRSTLLAPRELGILTLCLLAGTLPCLYLPWASMQHPPMMWGDSTTWSGFLDHLLRRHVGTFRLAATSFGEPASLIEQADDFMIHLILGTLWLGIPVALLGQVLSCLRGDHRSLAYVLFASFYFYVVTFLSLANLPLHSPLYVGIRARFFMQPMLLVFLWLGLGLDRLAGPASRLRWPFALSLVALQLGWHARDSDQRRNRYVEEFGRSILAPLPPRTLLFMKGDLVTNAVYYLKHSEGLRPDVTAIDLSRLTWGWSRAWMAAAHPDVALPGAAYQPGIAGHFDGKALVEANQGRRPIHLVGGLVPGDPGLGPTFELWPLGIGAEIRQASNPPDFEAWLADSDRSLPRFALPPVERYPPTTWEFVVREASWTARADRAEKILVEAVKRKDDPRLMRIAIESFEEILEASRVLRPTLLKLLGAALSRLPSRTPSEEARMVQVLRSYVAIADAGDPEAAEIRKRLPPVP